MFSVRKHISCSNPVSFIGNYYFCIIITQLPYLSFNIILRSSFSSKCATSHIIMADADKNDVCKWSRADGRQGVGFGITKIKRSQFHRIALAQRSDDLLLLILSFYFHYTTQPH
jgi:hypothetical protein